MFALMPLGQRIYPVGEWGKARRYNCPLCAIGYDTNHTKIWDMKDMNADYVNKKITYYLFNSKIFLIFVP